MRVSLSAASTQQLASSLRAAVSRRTTASIRRLSDACEAESSPRTSERASAAAAA